MRGARFVLPLVLAMAISLGLPPGALPERAGFPLAWMWLWLRQSPAFAANLIGGLPQQAMGDSDRTSRRVPTEATNHNGLSDGPPAQPRATKPFVTPNRLGTFDPATSVRIAEESTPTSDVYRNSDGSFARKVYQDPVNFRDGHGDWQRIDRSLRRNGTGRVGQTAADTDFTLGRDGADPDLVTMRMDAQHAYSYGLSGASAVSPNLDGNSATYSGVLPGVDLKLEVVGNGVKESLILHSAQVPASFDFPLNLQGLSASLAPNGSVLFRDGDGNLEASVPAGFMTDARFDRATGDFARSDDVRYELVNGGNTLRVTPDREWLNDPARAFPVTLDPSSFKETGDTYVYKTSSSDHSAENNLPVGTYDGGTHIARSLMHFTGFTSTFAGATISGAYLWAWLSWTYNCTAKKVLVKPITSSWDVSTIDWPGPSLGAEMGSATPNPGPACSNDDGNRSVGTGVTFPLQTAPIQAWLTGTANNGLALVAPSETDSTQWKRFTSRNYANYAYSPYLILIYTGPGTPQIDGAYPPTGYNSASLTPVLIAQAHDPDHSGSPFTYQFQVYDDAGTVIADSGRIASSSWQVPAGKLHKGESYSWAVVASDGATSSPPSVFSLSTLPVQPPVTSRLAENGVKGFEPGAGNYTTSATDVQIRTVGPPLDNRRTYNSFDTRRTLAFGTGWSSLADMRVSELDVDPTSHAPQTLSVVYSTGREAVFGRQGDNSWAPPQGSAAKLSCLNSASAVIVCPATVGSPVFGYRLQDRDGITYDFTQASGGTYGITSLTDTAGRKQTLAYVAGTLQVSKITSASGRSLNFAWTGGHVQSVSTDPATPGDTTTISTWTYTYSGDLLTKVCPPGDSLHCTGYTYAAASTGYPSLVENLGPTSNWRLNDAAGSAAASSNALEQGGADNGVPSPSVAFGQPGPLAGTPSTAASFNGTDSSIALPQNLVSESGYRSVSLWFKTTASGRVILGQSNQPITSATTNRNYTPTLYVDTNGKLVGQFPVAPGVANFGSLLAGEAGLCVDVVGPSPAPATIVHLWTCYNTTSQQWAWNSNGTIGTTVAGQLRCLDAVDGVANRGVVINACSTNANQKWRMDPNGNIVVGSTGRCLVVQKAAAQGNVLMVRDCVNPVSPEQVWTQSLHSPIVSTGAAVNDGQWHHAVLAASGNSQTLYQDSVAVGTKSGLVVAGNQKYQYLGAGFIGGNWPNLPGATTLTNVGHPSFFSGSLGEVAFFDRPLTAAQVSALKSARDNASRPLATITRPSGNIAADVRYDSLTGAVSQVTDENGGVWKVDAPVVEGSYLVHSSAVLGASPADYWRMSETGVSDAVNELDGGTAVYQGNVLLGSSEGPFGGATWAASFDGTGGYLQMPPEDAPGTQPMSVALWFRAPSAKTGTLFGYQDQPIGTQPGSWTPALYVGTDGRLRGKFWDGNATSILASVNRVDDGQWHHALLSASTNSQMLYLDGTAVSASPLAGTVNPLDMIYAQVGAGASQGQWPFAQQNYTGYFTGDIAEVSIYRKQLSAPVAAAQAGSRDKATGTALTKRYGITDPTGGKLIQQRFELPSGRLVESTDANGQRTRMGYDALTGLLATQTDPNGNYVQFVHDKQGNVTEQTSCQKRSSDPSAAICATVFYTYHFNASNLLDPCNGKLVASRDGRSSGPTDNAYLISYSYDSRCNLTSVTDPIGRVSRTGYSLPSGTEAFDGGRIPAGLPISVTAPGGGEQTISYYKNGDVGSIRDANGKLTTFAYDALGRVVRQNEQSDTYPTQYTDFSYDKQSRVVTQTMPRILNRVTGAYHQARSTFEYDFDGHNNKQTVTDLEGGDAPRIVSATFDSHGNLYQAMDAAGKTTTYSYNAFGQPTLVTNASGVAVATTYDPVGRELTSTLKGWTGDPNSPSAPTDLVISTIDYDPAGRVAGTVDAMGWVTSFDYYDDGSLWRKWRKESRDVGARAYLLEENFYDLAGNLIKQVTGNGSLVTNFEVDAASRQTGSVSDPGGLNRVVSSTFDDDDNAVSITSSDAAGAVLDVNRWSYDPMGNVLSHTIYNGPSGANPANAGTARWLNTATFDADALGSNTLTATGTVGSSATDHSPTAPAGASFDGTAYFSSATSAVDTRSSFTVSAWAKVNSTSIPVTIAGQDGTAVAGFTLFYNKAIDKWQFTMPRGDSRAAGYESVVSSAAATEGTWTHLAGVYDARAKTMKIYVNGTLAGTQKRVALPWGAAGKLIIGANKQGADLTARPDILIRDGAGAMSYYRNSGGDVATNSLPGTTVAVGTTANVPTALGDINGDGLADLLRCDSTGLLLQLNTGTGDSGTFSSTVTNLLSPCPYDQLGAGDVDGDGRADVVARATSGGNLVYHHNTGSNQLSPAITIKAGTAYNWLAMGDLDGDGRSDLILRNTNTNLYWLRSAGDGTFAADVLIGTSWANYSVTAGDFDGDGIVDVIAKGNAGAGVPGLFIYPNHPVNGVPNILSPRIQVGTGTWSNAVFLAAGNLNGDGEANLRGLVNDVQLYPRALTDAEIATVKASTLSPAGVFGEQTRYTLDKRGFVVAQTDPLGNVWNYQNDEAGRQVVTTAPSVATMTDGVLTTLPPVSTIGYDTFGSATETRDPTGKVTVTGYDAAGRATAQSLPAYTPPGSSTPLTPRMSRTFTPTGQVAAETDAMGNITSYTYDQMGRVAKVTLPSLKTMTSTYNLLGDALSVTDPAGARNTSTYDFLGRKCTATEIVRQPTTATNTTNFGFGPSETACTAAIIAGDPMRQSLVDSPSHFKTHATFNKFGEAVTATDPAGNVTRYQYDGAGRVSRTTLPDNTYVKPTYSLAGQVTATTAYTAADAVVASVSQTYDKAGRVVSSTDARGTTSTYIFDATGMLQQASQPTGTGTITDRYWYDPAGRQTRFMNGLNNSFDTRYNIWGLVEANVEPPTTAHPAAADRTFTVAYDKNGRVATEINPGNVTVANTYDSMGNLKTQHGVAGSVVTDRTFSYDDSGRMTQFSAPGGTNTISYDDRGLPLSVNGPSGNASFAWGADGQMLTRADAAGSTGYAYDTAGRLKTVTNGTIKLDYSYTNLNQVQTIAHGNGDTRFFSYHSGTHRLIADELKTAAGAGVGKITYDWDPNGNEISKTTTGFGGPAVTNTYLYDLADRLTSWSDGVHSTAYTYDAAGNRTSAGNTTFTYDARNRLLSSSAGSTSYTYTPRGTLSGTVVGTVTTPTTADAFDQVTGQAGQTYNYDALGRSVRSGHSFSGTGNDLAADATAQYIRTPEGDLASVASGATKLYAWTDLHSDVVAQFGATDTALPRTATYDPFGKPIGTPALLGSLGFQSEWTDTSTGRVNMAARWYNPDTGQFDTRDSVEDPGNPNRYSYVANNPLSNVDPGGHMRMPEERGTPVTVKPKTPVGPVCHGSEYSGGCGSGTDHRKPQPQCHGGENRPDCGYQHQKPDPVKKTCQRVIGDHTGCMLDPPKQVVCPTASGAKMFEHCTTLRETKDYCEINGAVIPKDQLPAQARNCEEYARIMDMRGGQYEGYEDGSERDHITAFLIGEVIQDTVLKGIEKAEAEKKAKCQASFWCRNAGVVGTIAGAVAGVIVGAVCLAVTAGAGSVGCAFAAGFVGGFVGSLTTGALQGKSGAELWGGALVDGLIGGVIGVLTLGLGAGLGAGVRALVSKVGSKAAGQAVSSAARQAATRAANTAAGKAVNTTLTFARNTAIKIENKVGSRVACTGVEIMSEVAQEAVSLHSFDPATKVLLASGVAVAIADIKLGDKVLATDPHTGQTSEQPVTMLHRNVDLDLTDITVSTGPESGQTTVLHTTQHHPLWDATTGSWVIAAGLKAGVSTLTAPDGTVQYVTEVRNFNGSKEMRDLTVAQVHTYYVLANDRPVLVHNNCESGGGGPGFTPAGATNNLNDKDAALRDLLARSKAGDVSAREEIARLTGGRYFDPNASNNDAIVSRAAEEDDLFEPDSRRPFQPPRTKVSRPSTGKKGRVADTLMRIIPWLMPPWGRF